MIWLLGVYLVGVVFIYRSIRGPKRWLMLAEVEAAVLGRLEHD